MEGKKHNLEFGTLWCVRPNPDWLLKPDVGLSFFFFFFKKKCFLSEWVRRHFLILILNFEFCQTFYLFFICYIDIHVNEIWAS